MWVWLGAWHTPEVPACAGTTERRRAYPWRSVGSFATGAFRRPVRRRWGLAGCCLTLSGERIAMPSAHPGPRHRQFVEPQREACGRDGLILRRLPCSVTWDRHPHRSFSRGFHPTSRLRPPPRPDVRNGASCTTFVPVCQAQTSTAWITTPTSPPTKVPLTRIYWRSRPTAFSSRPVTVSASQLRIVSETKVTMPSP
jgi:hypothetical protein